ncbi:MAG: metal-dependent transcriptional regulator [Gemmatimonadales bacterium]|nr:metal-dependent transcriptional regulator [Gemmatimonadales bacterium]
MTALPAREPLTRSTEDYLKAIYRLSSGGAPVSTNDIAGLLGLAPASVSGMIKRLSEQGLLEHMPYRGVSLTPDGRRVALRMLRRHRLIEAYLVAFLGHTWDTVHEEAERLEHAVSDDLVERMAHALGNPRVDPHGDPIPAPDGTIAEFIHVPLAEIAAGESVTIGRVDARDDGRLRYLAQHGLVPGARIAVVDREPFGGPLTLDVAGQRKIVGPELAALILCERGGG